MRYFKYKNTDKNYSIALKEQYNALINDEKRTFRKEKYWRKFSLIVSSVIFFSSVTAGFLLLKSVPQPSGIIWQFFASIVKTVIGFIILIAGGVLTAGLTKPLWNKADSFRLPVIKKEIISKACDHLRSYYGLTEPYIVTKCFDASDPKFKNHDVCIFVAGDELRITANLIQGFLHGDRDLGCYAFKMHEITFSKRQKGKQLLAELKADNMFFILGYRSKAFFEKNCISDT